MGACPVGACRRLLRRLSQSLLSRILLNACARKAGAHRRLQLQAPLRHGLRRVVTGAPAARIAQNRYRRPQAPQAPTGAHRRLQAPTGAYRRYRKRNAKRKQKLKKAKKISSGRAKSASAFFFPLFFSPRLQTNRQNGTRFFFPRFFYRK